MNQAEAGSMGARACAANGTRHRLTREERAAGGRVRARGNLVEIGRAHRIRPGERKGLDPLVATAIRLMLRSMRREPATPPLWQLAGTERGWWPR